MQRKVKCLLVLVVICLWGMASSAIAAPLGSYNIIEEIGTGPNEEIGLGPLYPVEAEGLGIHISLSHFGQWDPDNLPPSYSLFDRMRFFSVDVGQTFIIDQSVDSDFDGFVESLTNGITDYYRFTFSGTTDTGSGLVSLQFPSEHNVLGSWGANGIDLAGYNIDSVSLTLNELDFDAVNDEGYRVCYLDADFTVYGSPVPEPASLLLLGSGLLGLGVLKKKKV